MRSADPTRTTGLRRKFMAEMNKRFLAVRSAVRNLVVVEDAFGLRTGLTANTRFQFQTNPEKVESFQQWFQAEIDAKALSVSTTGEPWTAPYVDSAYKKGQARAFLDTKKAKLADDLDFFNGSRAQFLESSLAVAESTKKIELLYKRAFDGLKGITREMDAQMSRVLADGLANGLGPRQIARELNKKVEGLTRKRALVLARTEIVHAHAEGQLDGFEHLGVEELGVMAEWSTAGDDRVCPRCLAMEGQIFTIKEARGLIPLHPSCRCAWIPYQGKK